MTNTLNRGTILLLGVIAQAAITALFLWRALPLIEADLEDRAQLALAARNISWARTEVDGRDLTVRGLAPDQEQRQRALDALAEVRGLRRIDDQLQTVGSGSPAPRATDAGEPAPAGAIDPDSIVAQIKQEKASAIAAMDLPYVFSIEREGRLITLSGMAPDTTARESLVAMARQKFGDGQVMDELIINPSSPPDFLFAATQALNVAEYVADGAVGVRDRELFVNGMAASDRDLESLKSLIDATLPDGYSSSVQLGSRQQLDALLRENPSLADRVGRLPALAPRATGDGIDLGRSTSPRPQAGRPQPVAAPLDRSPAAAERCQREFDALLDQQRISFDTGSAAISSSSRALLDQLVTIAKSCPAARIEIAGHTDDQGTDENNLALSQRRAEAVMEFLVSHGVALGRLTATGYGESRPLVENRTAADRARNRRIEFEIQ
jgi:OOP family OmpA-OmpF porin